MALLAPSPEEREWVRMKSNSASTDNRKRNFVFVVAQESAPSDWQEVLASEHVPAFISPLHCDDVNADGSKKFNHWHVLLMFKGKKSIEQVREIAHRCGAVNDFVEVCQDVRGYARYLTHRDNPEKAQYSAADVVALGGADYLATVGTAVDTDAAVGEMMDWCIEQGVYSFFRLSNYARRERPDWFRVLTSSRTVFLTNWLKSMQWEIQQGTFDDAVSPSAERTIDGPDSIVVL